ncbi:hypothetical protein SASPL_119241 [Salvia splendens]|uniref:Glycosyl hydrolase family 32 N-terminal domain-containing protein n=1 Tax=Salvia splendens TaxID=180675 RepID=A0A8X8XT76_SALSN|nr:hypothetical protein SASPL_119241 [Salvia splendens]
MFMLHLVFLLLLSSSFLDTVTLFFGVSSLWLWFVLHPAFHYTTGPMLYNGVYHLFYQYNPYAAIWGNISWGHSVSYNHLEPALNPTEKYDINGCWSGSATLLAGESKPVILYTGSDFLGQQVQNLAMPKDLSDPLLREWLKVRMALGMYSWGARLEAMGARSRDFVKWERASRPLQESNKTAMWECPDFYPVGDDGRYVLKASFNDHDYYVLGSYDAETDEFGVTFYDDARKRRVLWGWVTEADSEAGDVERG